VDDFIITGEGGGGGGGGGGWSVICSPLGGLVKGDIVNDYTVMHSGSI
jgi:hypothetical protein